MTMTTVLQRNTDQTGRPLEPFGPYRRSPLAALLVLSLALHAAAIGFWPQSGPTVSEPLPAGPVHLELQNSGAGGSRSASAAPPAAPTEATPDATNERPQRSHPVKGAQPELRRAEPRRAAAPSKPIRNAVSAPAPPGTSPVPARPATQASGPVGDDALRDQLRGRLQRALIAHFEYPLLARRRGWEGVVRIGLRVEPDGQLSRLRVIGSSGHRSLDRAALDSLHRVGTLADVAGWLQGRQFDMVLPVRYQLIDS